MQNAGDLLSRRAGLKAKNSITWGFKSPLWNDLKGSTRGCQTEAHKVSTVLKYEPDSANFTVKSWSILTKLTGSQRKAAETGVMWCCVFKAVRSLAAAVRDRVVWVSYSNPAWRRWERGGLLQHREIVSFLRWWLIDKSMPIQLVLHVIQMWDFSQLLILNSWKSVWHLKRWLYLITFENDGSVEKVSAPCWFDSWGCVNGTSHR